MASTAIYLGKEFSIQPNYIFARNVWDGSGGYRSLAQLETKDNLKNNTHKGIISAQSIKKMRQAINWLTAAAVNKHVFDAKTQKSYYFKTNFITLTVPAEGNILPYKQFHKLLLNPFLTYARKYFAMVNFVWKLEMSSSGIPHVHITSDTFINHARLRRAWNKILASRGLIDGYTAKYINMPFSQYVSIRKPINEDEYVQVQSAYVKGCADKWSNPNSTDVHSTKGVRNLAAYLCSYLTKNKSKYASNKGRVKSLRLRGRVRVWGCSYSLSQNNKCKVHLFPNEIGQETKGLYSKFIDYLPIEGPVRSAGLPSIVGEIFFFASDKWASVIKGVLYDKFKNHILKIRHKTADLFNEYANKLQEIPAILAGCDTAPSLITCEKQVRKVPNIKQGVLHLS